MQVILGNMRPNELSRAKFEKIIGDGQQSFFWAHICERFITPYHYHPEYELIHIRRGEGRRLVGDSIRHFGPGDLVFIAPNVPHLWKLAPECQQGEAIYIQVLPQFLGAEFMNLTETKPVMEWMAAVGAGMTFSPAIQAEVAFRLNRFRSLGKLERLLDLLDILRCLSRDSGSRPLGHGTGRIDLSTRHGKQLAQVFEYLNENLGGPITQADIARKVRLSSSAFSRFFKHATGKCFMEVVGELRIAQVCRQLAETDLTILEIAYSCGFGNLSHFNRQFRRAMKMPPREYRLLHQSVEH